MNCGCRVVIEHLPIASESEGGPVQWYGVVDASPLVQANALLFNRLTGLFSDELGPEDYALRCPPIAGDRGLPPNASEEALRVYVHARHITWATPREIERAFKPLTISEKQWGWRFVRDTVRLLASHYGDESVRVVLGFDPPEAL